MLRLFVLSHQTRLESSNSFQNDNKRRLSFNTHQFYSYVFANRANLAAQNNQAIIEQGMQHAMTRITTTPSKRSANRTKKLISVDEVMIRKEKEKHNKLIQFFSTLKIQPNFRAALRSLKSAHLEQVLYGNNTDVIAAKYQFLNHENIVEKFLALEKEHHYFSVEGQQTNNNLEKYKVLVNLCQLLGDCVENNSENEYAHIAYKMLVIFNKDHVEDILKAFDGYLKAHNYLDIHSFLHALKFSIPNNRFSVDLKQWRKFILYNGQLAMKIFAMAPAIENKLNRSPKDFNEAYETAKLIDLVKLSHYKNANKNPALADLCVECKISEAVFEECLSLEKSAKTKDNLPNIIIDGNEINQPGYYFVKLSIVDSNIDPNVFLSGYFTGCCLKMGCNFAFDGQQCIEDAIKYENNSLYVLLKARHEGVSKADLFNSRGHINNKKVVLVGGSYTCITEHHNVLFDTWDNRIFADNAVIIPFLQEFSRQVTEAKDSKVVRVLIGMGGKMPPYGKNAEPVTNPEAILQGQQHPDSSSQTLVYFSKSRHEYLVNALKNFLLDSGLSESVLDAFMRPQDIFSFKQCEELKILLQTNTVKCLLKQSDNVASLIDDFKNKPDTLFLGRILRHLPTDLHAALMDELTSHGWDWMIWNSARLGKVLSTLLGEGQQERLIKSLGQEKIQRIIPTLKKFNLLLHELQEKLQASVAELFWKDLLQSYHPAPDVFDFMILLKALPDTELALFFQRIDPETIQPFIDVLINEKSCRDFLPEEKQKVVMKFLEEWMSTKQVFSVGSCKF